MQYYVMKSDDYAYIVETDDVSKAKTPYNTLIAICEREFYAQLLVAAINVNRSIILTPYDQKIDTKAWHCVTWPLRTWLCDQHKIEINDTICPECANDQCLGKK